MEHVPISGTCLHQWPISASYRNFLKLVKNAKTRCDGEALEVDLLSMLAWSCCVFGISERNLS